jgi:hypothetical protein
MGRAGVSNPCPDLSSFDLEASELMGCLMDAGASRMTLQLRCSVAWWPVRKQFASVCRWLKLDRVIGLGPIEFDVEIILHGLWTSRDPCLAKIRG